MSSLFANALLAQDKTQEALQRAIDALATKGIYDPTLTPTGDPIEKYDQIQEYRRQLAEMTVKFLKEAKPVETHQPVKPSREYWHD